MVEVSFLSIFCLTKKRSLTTHLSVVFLILICSLKLSIFIADIVYIPWSQVLVLNIIKIAMNVAFPHVISGWAILMFFFQNLYLHGCQFCIFSKFFRRIMSLYWIRFFDLCRLFVSRMSWSAILPSSWDMLMPKFINAKMIDALGLCAISMFVFMVAWISIFYFCSSHYGLYNSQGIREWKRGQSSLWCARIWEC